MFLENRIIAHRGGFFDNQKIYENTKEAFQIAIQKGLAIELDVHVTKDEQALSYIKNLGYNAMPVVYVDEKTHWFGFRPDELEKLVAE